MKRFLTVLFLLSFVLLLCGCSQGTKDPGPDEFYVNLVNNSADKISCFEMEYGTGETAHGGSGVCYADNSPIKPKDSMRRDFLTFDFPDTAELTDFWLELNVIDTEGISHAVKPVVRFGPSFGEEYTISVSGSTASGYKAVLTK